MTLLSALDHFPPCRKYLVGISGGCDSMVLLDALRERGFVNLVVCHFNHGLRPREARRDARLVARAAQAAGATFEYGEADTAEHARSQRVSVEMAARDLRFRFFETCAAAHRCQRIFLAHHADDQVETILLNLFRGTGLAGLAGMKPQSRVGRLDVLRPFLALPREIIRAYAKQRRIAFAEDASNSSRDYTRNRIRHDLVPRIKEIFPSATDALLRLAGIVRDEEDYLAAETPVFGETIPVAQLRALPPALRARAVLQWLRARDIRDPGFAETSAVLSLLDTADGPAKINLPAARHVRRSQGKIFVE